MRRLVFLAAIAGSLNAQDAAEIVRKSLERDQINFDRLKNYTYQQRDVTREYDSKGNLKKTEIETYEIMMLGGRPYDRLVARDDKPLPESEARKQREKLDKESAKRAHETAADKAKIQKEREQERRYFREIPNAFELRLAGVEQISGHPAWVIDAQPRQGYKPPSLPRANLLTKVRAKIWIDQKEHQWVKADVQVIDTLSFGLGLFRLAPGGSLLFEQTRVNDEVWLPSKAAIRAEGRLAFIKKMRAEVDIAFKDYRKFQAESKLVGVEEKKN